MCCCELINEGYTSFKGLEDVINLADNKKRKKTIWITLKKWINNVPTNTDDSRVDLPWCHNIQRIKAHGSAIAGLDLIE